MLKNKCTIGIIAGTPFDTKLGVSSIQNLGYKTLPYPISTSPEIQTEVQMDSKLLTINVSAGIDSLIKQGASAILIYCNSISLTIDLNFLKAKYAIPIFSPADIIKTLKIHEETVGLIAANCQAVGKTEEVIIKNNPVCTIIGVGFLPLISMIEKSSCPAETIKKNGLLELFRFFIKNRCKQIILGCTHFSYFYSDLELLISEENLDITFIPIFDMVLEEIQKTFSTNLVSIISN